MMIRPERRTEYRMVELIHECAFGGKREADVVRSVRHSAGHRPEWSLVFEESGQIMGHVLFSYVGLERDDQTIRRIAVLAPLAVLPERQRRGVGSALLAYGTESLESLSEPLVVVRGDIAYYGQFGFEPSFKVGIRPPFEVAPDHYLVRILPAYSRNYRGTVRYPATFKAVGYQAEWDYSMHEIGT